MATSSAQEVRPNGKPLVVGHRGLPARNPENTIQSFREALKAGANGIETDIQLTLDGELALLHDPKLDRTTNGTGFAKDHNWHGYIDGLHTKREPHLPLPRLNDLLELLMEPETIEKEVWVLLDIKTTNGPKVLDFLQTVIAKYSETHDFSRQVVLGIWQPSFIEPAQRLFPNYRLSFIGMSLAAARTYFWVACDSFNLNFAVLVDDNGQSFITKAHAAGKKVYVWTVNDPDHARECIRWGVDGLLGDDSAQLVEILAEERKATDTTIARRMPWLTFQRRVYYYFITRLMRFASWRFLGV